MYAIVDFTDIRNEQSFNVVETTQDVEYAKKLAFHLAKKELSKEKNTEKYFYKITTTKDYEYEYLYPLNKIIIAYKIIELIKYKNGFTISSCNANIYAVIELKQREAIQDIDEIDVSLICDNYYSYDGCDDDDDDDE